MADHSSQFSAAEQGLGYIYQPRFALLQALSLPEDCVIFIERNDDVEFVEVNGRASLNSLKHKDPGDRLTDLSADFWKSVRIWLSHYKATGRATSNARFFLFTTASISSRSFLNDFATMDADGDLRAEVATSALAASQADLIEKIREEIKELSEEELSDFYARITIFAETPRIEEIPILIRNRLITVRRQSRQELFERLEGWWAGQVIELLTGVRSEPIKVQEATDKLALLADEYKSDNLPITLADAFPEGGVDAKADSRRFVEQLRALELSTDRIRFAIIDYYRAFEQRSQWVRANLLVSNEMEVYEDKLVEEWDRYRAFVCEAITDDTAESECIRVGKELYRWAEEATGQPRIRERVAEPYVIRGTFHILANNSPLPRVHWHPRFLKRLAEILGAAA